MWPWPESWAVVTPRTPRRGGLTLSPHRQTGARRREGRTSHGRRRAPLPRLEWLRVDDCEDLDFCLLTVIITCSCTRCLPDVPVFIFWSEGKASVELSWSWKHSYASAVLSGEWFMVAVGWGWGARAGGAERRRVRCSGVRARVLLSAAPYGHRALVRLRLPAAAPGASAPARPSAGTGGARPPSDRIYHPCPAPPTPPARHSDASCRALPLRGGRWGVCWRGVRGGGVPGVQSSQPRPSSPPPLRSRGDAPRLCSYWLLEKVCAQLRSEGDLCRGKGNLGSAPLLAP